MREKNKQANNSQLFQGKFPFNKKISVLFKKKITYQNIIFLIAICVIGILVLTNNSFAAFTSQEMEEFQSNEMISGMCYVYKIMTSNLTKAIAAAFVMGSGWLFFLGGIKDWKPILSLSIAITLIFGGFEIANIISRNDYTCNKIAEEAEKDKNNSGEKTTFTIKEIEAYSPGQEWRICDKDVENLNFANCEIIDENDEISVDDDRDLILYKCQSGYFKELDNAYLKYRYDTKDKLAGKFILLNTENVSNLSTGTNNILKQLECKRTCKLSRLISLLEVYHAKNTNTFQILNNSGKLKENNYYTIGTQIDLSCLPEYKEYNENNEPSESGLIAFCNSNGEFEFQGSCKGKCNLDSYSNKDSFIEWEKYNPKINKWGKSTTKEFFYGEKIRIKTCNTKDGYSFAGGSSITDDDKLVLMCSSIGNSAAWISQGSGKSCSKFCKLSDYIYYKEHNWKKGCTIKGCTTTVETNKEDLFEAGTTLGISGCKDTSYNLDTSKETLKITCNENGKWDDNGGNKCFGKCNPNTIKFYNYADDWKLCIGENCRTVKYENIGEVENGTTLQQLTCKTGYDFYNKDKSTIFECRNGIFERQSGHYNEVCMKGCNDASPVFDIDNLKVSDKMYGITFASNNTDSAMHVYLVCYKNANTSTLFTLNPNGTGLGSVRSGDYINCSYDSSNLRNYYTSTGRILTCMQDDSINNGEPYWQNMAKSCDLNELKNYPGISVKLAYGGYGASYAKDINTIMTTGSKQVRFLPYHNNNTSIDLNWSKPYVIFNPENGGNITAQCNNGNWEISITVKVDYCSSKDSAKVKSKYFNENEDVCCNNDTFGDVHEGTVKVCKINGIKVADENGCFKANLQN